MRGLWHRWFVQYNPLYLSSATLVLFGVTLLSSKWPLLSAAIAELYAWALIGGAALLTRKRLKRPAVMLALLAVVYQGDLTLHTETCAYLGAAGTVASGAWLASFVLKLRALGWALELEPSRSALAVPVLGAIGLTLLPHLFGVLGHEHSSTAVGFWLFGVFAAGLWTRRSVSSSVALDDWGNTVLRRGLRATWLIWALLGLCHAVFWTGELGLSRALWIPVALLLSTRFVQSELGVWGLVLAALALATVEPALFAPTASMAAVVLALRALRKPTWRETRAMPPGANTPYRFAPEHPHAPRLLLEFAPSDAAALARLATGSLSALYLAAWTAGWKAGPWPEHVLALDAASIAVLAFAIWRFRVALPALPAAATTFHFALRTGVVSLPDTELEWGLAAVALGFFLLGSSLFASFRYDRTRWPAEPPSTRS